MNGHALAVSGRRRTNGLREVELTRLPQAAHDITHVAKEQPCDGMRLADVICRLALRETRRDVELKTKCSQVMPQRVVQVARDAQPLLDPAALRKQRSCAQQFPVDSRQLIAR